MVSVYPLLLFGGGSISIDLDKGNFVMSVDDGWIRFMASSNEVRTSHKTGLPPSNPPGNLHINSGYN